MNFTRQSCSGLKNWKMQLKMCQKRWKECFGDMMEWVKITIQTNFHNFKIRRSIDWLIDWLIDFLYRQAPHQAPAHPPSRGGGRPGGAAAKLGRRRRRGRGGGGGGGPAQLEEQSHNVRPHCCKSSFPPTSH